MLIYGLLLTPLIASSTNSSSDADAVLGLVLILLIISITLAVINTVRIKRVYNILKNIEHIPWSLAKINNKLEDLEKSKKLPLGISPEPIAETEVKINKITDDNELIQHTQKEVSKLETITKPPPLPSLESRFNTASKSDTKPHTPHQEKAGDTQKPHNKPSTTTDDKEPVFIRWFKEDWIMKVGSLMLLMALGWFVTFAFMNMWIGPTGRIIAGVVGSLTLLMIGSKRISKYPNQGGVFLSVGTVTMILTMFAASNYYTVLPPLVGLILSAGTLIYLSTIAIKMRYKPLVYLSIALASIMPFLFGYLGITEFTFGYLLILIGYLTFLNWKWPQIELPIITSSILFLYSVPSIVFEFNNWSNPNSLTLTLVFISIALALAQNLYGYSTPKREGDKDKNNQLPFNIASSGLTTLCLIGWSMKIGSGDTPGYFLMGWATICGLLAILSHKYIKNNNALFTLWTISTLLFILSFNILLEPPILTLALTGFCVLTTAIGYNIGRLRNVINLEVYSSFLFLVPCINALESINYNLWQNSILNPHSLCLIALATSLLIVGYFLKALHNHSPNDTKIIVSRTLTILGSIYGFVWIWLILKLTLPEALATSLSLSIYTIIGIICYFKGIRNNSKTLERYGLTLISLIIIRLFLLDLWNMETLTRIITFFLVGILLISTAFFGKKEKDKLKINGGKNSP
jgi:uncharacterized membrane protein